MHMHVLLVCAPADTCCAAHMLLLLQVAAKVQNWRVIQLVRGLGKVWQASAAKAAILHSFTHTSLIVR